MPWYASRCSSPTSHRDELDFRCWRPSASSLRNNWLVARGEADEARTPQARHSAGRGNEIMSLWDSPRQPETYNWSTSELANVRTAFPGAGDKDDMWWGPPRPRRS